MPASRADVIRRLTSRGIAPLQSFLRASLPTSRAAWAFLTGETIATTQRPATRDEALSLPAFGRGVELIASAVAGVPIRAYRWDAATGTPVRLADQPTVLVDPDPTSTAWHWRYGVVKDLIEAGGHLSLLGDLDWRTGRPGWLVPLAAQHCGLVTDTSRPGWYAFTFAGIMLDPSEVLYISAGNRSGEVLGQSVVAQYAKSLGQQLSAEDWSHRYLDGGGLPPAIIQASGTPTPAQILDFKAKWRSLVATGEAIIIPAGSTVTPLQSDAERQQLVQARTWNAQLAAMILGIPSYKLGLPGPTMTYANAEFADIDWVKDTVDRWAQPIQEALTKHLLPAGWQAQFDWKARARTDLKTQADVVTQLVGGPVLTRDEGRQMLQYAPDADAIDEGTTPDGVPDLGSGEIA